MSRYHLLQPENFEFSQFQIRAPKKTSIQQFTILNNQYQNNNYPNEVIKKLIKTWAPVFLTRLQEQNTPDRVGRQRAHDHVIEYNKTGGLF